MDLGELNDKLHSRDVHWDRARKPTLFEPKGVQTDPTAVSEFHQTESWQDAAHVEQPTSSSERWRKFRKILTISLGAIALLAFATGLIIKFSTFYFNEANVLVTLRGAETVESTQSATFVFDYTNNNYASLKDAVVVFEYPESFIPDQQSNLSLSPSRAEMKVGTIASHGHAEVKISGKFYSSREEEAVITGTLQYDGGKVLKKSVEHRVFITALPFLFEITAPVEVVSQQEVQYQVRYRNNGTVTFPHLEVHMQYPRGFTFMSAEPRSMDHDTAVWSVENLKPGEERVISIRGVLAGEREEQKLMYGGIGTTREDGTFVMFRDHERRTKVVASPFLIIQTVNKSPISVSAQAGETLTYVVQYKNDGNVGIRDAILTVEIDSPYLNFGSLQFGQSASGAYLPSSKSIVWKASDMKALSRVEPGESGEVSFSINTYEDLKERFPDARELSIRSVAKIDSPDIPVLNGVTKVVASSPALVKINAPLVLELKGAYEDTTFPNSGPVPPVAGQETTYTFHYVVTGFLNNVENARVSMMLPATVRYTGKRSPENENMTFNERSNELVWDIGTLEPGKSRELVFQIGVTPNTSGLGQEVVLITKNTFTGRDTFTGQDIKLEKERKTSNTL
jgi:hypothetical protein